MKKTKKNENPFPSFPSLDSRERLLELVQIPSKSCGAIRIRGIERMSKQQLAAIVDAYSMIFEHGDKL